MVNVIVELSRYLIIILMALYTLQCFTVFKERNEREKKHILRKQLFLIYFMDLVAFTVIFLKMQKIEILTFFAAQLIYFTVVQILYRIIYKKAAFLVLNHMCMLLSIGFIMLARLDLERAVKQFQIVVIATVIALVIPVMIRRMKFLNQLTWVYAGAGFVLLAVVLVLGRTEYGAKLSINLGSFSFQPSEFVKIIFVFFVASMLYKNTEFIQVVKATVVAGAYVLILVASKDLGSAVVFFITYLAMVYVATKKPLYLAAGAGGGCVAAVGAYFLFNHVRQRVVAWKDPFSVYDREGYQIVQSLFAIGTGSWFGMGLCQGAPDSIPVVKQDFIFAAICEELGGIFAMCLILVCMSLFLMVVNISLQIKNPFYKLIALGLGTEYAFQVFLTIGGATKFIPMTGITLPLVSYGGSSVLSTIIMLAIVQGLYILREDEDEELGKQKERRRAQTNQKRAKTKS
ncbi:FtsW/RodA/SpoVE family cell cycle protein [Lactonifactor longoviformis]|uniref:FtsW/RodA/SpoVE family cell cycle protein n=1 Tax=Lactonifactor TaxID=420345 RepID=UPI001309FEA5|nr:FtsW/RodA/SpoVE family cell cycle protein [Lactonifactor longoviformis]MSA01810.1 FtsW/RodA/SpoVE family cell cycle protein [Lactonifactor sp. BIOML-A5]MSA08324.1 FtsW/RodA/SpoVE family cell cycle protein [Lactonifactor sp. BIOML-A4]MSA12746.1 FtsW/RodA/SpoVE family cell cycle protein [Lactonifactor sp. BIOML-A3]MSA17386.1 FtsW/RodA/SpoVE family cell cycle protein [Lactonifactor sp. BIOML-A2]MSA37963.1 FtsW/RodA/SpoVE family cell cycle protein [Lactonifactor sp. BIOML-A1]MSB13790.1 FtsW/Ro